MSKFRPFVPPQAPAPVGATKPAPAFPTADLQTSTPSGTGRAYVPPPLVDDEPSIDLQAMLDAAQREVDALQAESATKQKAFDQEKTRFQSAVSVLDESRARACEVLAKDAVQLGVEIAHALVGRAFEVDKDHLLGLVEKCLREFSTEQPVQVRVSKADAAHVQAHLASEHADSVQVVSDESMSPGDLSVEAEALVIDARVSERVSMLRDELAAAVRADEALEPEPEAPEEAAS